MKPVRRQSTLALAAVASSSRAAASRSTVVVRAGDALLIAWRGRSRIQRERGTYAVPLVLRDGRRRVYQCYC